MVSVSRLMIAGLALVTLLSATSGCNDIPVTGLTDSFSVKVRLSEENAEAIKVDFLWVIDDSASMCQEQASLAESFNEFLSRITSFVNIDYRIAVVTTDMLSDDKIAKFRHHRTTEFPFACTQKEAQACVRESQQGDVTPELESLCPAGDCSCSNLGPGWVCNAPNKVDSILNCNVTGGERTLNSSCNLTCIENADCDRAFLGDEQAARCSNNETDCAYKCLSPSGDPANSGCVLRPETAACPGDNEIRDLLIQGAGNVCANGDSCTVNTPCRDGSACGPANVPFLTPQTAGDFFKCVGVVGAEQHNNANLEQGLNAAIWALDPSGPNTDQSRTFLRDDAYLVVVFVSDEDDCSTDECGVDPKDGVWKCGSTLAKEKYGRCTCEQDATQGGPILPVSVAVNKVKALKDDPGRVLVAAIVGDSQADPLMSPEVVEAERAQYLQSKCNMCPDEQYKHPLLFNTYICASSAGKADLGKRYIQFVQAFGANGIITNICSDEGVGPALGQIADRIIRVFTKVCLPRRIQDDQTLVVKQRGPSGTCTDGSACCTVKSTECTAEPTCGDGSQCIPEEKTIEASDVPDTPTYRIEVTSDCFDEADKKAIVFNSLVPPGTDLLIDYVGDPTPTLSP